MTCFIGKARPSHKRGPIYASIFLFHFWILPFAEFRSGRRSRPVITKSEIVALWLEACPSFGPAFAASCATGTEELLYIHAGVFAHHLLSIHRSQRRDEFPAIASFIERLYTDGDQYTREFATIGILEGIQNVWGHSDVSPDEFLPFLHPFSVAAWHSLNQFWTGEIPFVPDPTHK